MEKEGKMTWYDVPYYKWKQLEPVLASDDDFERLAGVAELLLGEDVTDLPLNEFVKATKKLEFLNTPMPEKNPPKKLTIDGKKYYMDCLLGNITTAQYIDYTNHAKSNDIVKMLSVFIIPEGHKYNDGYNMEEVFADIEKVSIGVINNAAFFFAKQFALFVKIFRRYSNKMIKKTDLPKEMKEQLIKLTNNSVDLALFPLSSNFVK